MDILASGKGRNYGAAVDLSNRELFWAIAFKMFKTSPIFGHGMMAYDNYYNDFFNHDYTFAGAHNSYFQLFADSSFRYKRLLLPTCLNVEEKRRMERTKEQPD